MQIYEIEKIAIDALKNSKKKVDELGNSGLNKVINNQFDEMSLVGDIEAEKVVIQTLRDAQMPIRIISEEHGTIDITDNPIYLGILDGIDGTNSYKKNIKDGRYGTMFGIFSNIDPVYDDYLFGGVMEHTTNKLYYASKQNGCRILEGNKIIGIKYPNKTEFNQEIKIYIDEPFDILEETFRSRLKGYNIQTHEASCVQFVDLVSGITDLTLQCTRKHNLEIAIAYGMLKETDCSIVTLDGQSIGPKKYLEFGQEKDEHIPIIAASTYELAQKLIEYIKSF